MPRKLPKKHLKLKWKAETYDYGLIYKQWSHAFVKQIQKRVLVILILSVISYIYIYTFVLK